jgi:hypothetical protein
LIDDGRAPLLGFIKTVTVRHLSKSAEHMLVVGSAGARTLLWLWIRRLRKSAPKDAQLRIGE